MRQGNTHLLYNTPAIETRKLLILTALQLEAHAIAKALRARGLRAPNDAPTLRVIGIGARRLAAFDPQVECVLLAGLAGALDPSLRVGDLILDEQSLSSPSPSTLGVGQDEGIAPSAPRSTGIPACVLSPVPLPPTPALCALAAGKVDAAFLSPSTRPKRGRVHTASALIATPAAKASLHAQTGAHIVQMESSVVRDRAHLAGLPFIGLHAISDAADGALDPTVLRLVDETGRVRLRALLSAVIRRPTLLRDLWQLRNATRLATRRLGNAAADLVAHLRDAPTAFAASEQATRAAQADPPPTRHAAPEAAR